MGRTVKPWYISNPALYDKVRQLVLSHFPTLVVQIENRIVYIRGILPIRDLTISQEIDRYLIEIQLPNNYPKEVPIVQERGGRIPRDIDRHIIDNNGTCCLFVRDEQWRHYPEGTTIIEFINGPVYQFFLGQTYFELTRKWIFGDRGHGVSGILEYYSEELGTRDIKFILSFLEYLSRKVVKGHWQCFCGNGKLLRHCHFAKVIEMREKVPYLVARDSFIKVISEVKQALKARSQSQPLNDSKKETVL